MEVKKDDCPKGMANIDNQYCIDQYEASIVDKTTGEFASPNYIPSQEDFHNTDWQYNLFKNKPIPKNKMKILRFAIPTTAELWGITQIFKMDFQSFLADRCRATGYLYPSEE